MQTTLLGISVAIILALVTALVGPHFVDWKEHRAYFEAEASRLVGQPVRIGGAIDLRLLPTPTLTLGQIEVGSAVQPQARARELHVELALGALVRGEVRASEMRIAGPDISLGETKSQCMGDRKFPDYFFKGNKNTRPTGSRIAMNRHV